jgi:hypothetical protein
MCALHSNFSIRHHGWLCLIVALPLISLVPSGFCGESDFTKFQPSIPPSEVAPVAPAPEVPAQRGYLGVALTELCPEVRAQTSLKDGEGLMITRVAPDSPAAALGLAHYDILTRLDDQWIMSPAQFVTLVENAGPGKEVEITYFRRGVAVKARVRLGSMSARPAPTQPAVLLPEEMLASIIRSLRDNPVLLEPIHRLLQGGPFPSGADPFEGDVLKQGSRITQLDPAGEIELTIVGKKETLRAWDPGGKLIFDGPCATEKEIEALPVELKERLQHLKVQCFESPRKTKAREAKGEPQEAAGKP